jgi:signal transduction histidine kinase
MVGDLRDIVWSIDPESDRVQDVVGRMRDVTGDLLRDVAVTFRGPEGAQLTQKIGMAARRDLLLLYKEALHNVVRHSRAKSVTIDLRVDGSRLELVVADDGVGFTPRRGASGLGLRSLRERAERLGADLELQSDPGRGTTVRVELQMS